MPPRSSLRTQARPLLPVLDDDDEPSLSSLAQRHCSSSKRWGYTCGVVAATVLITQCVTALLLYAFFVPAHPSGGGSGPATHMPSFALQSNSWLQPAAPGSSAVMPVTAAVAWPLATQDAEEHALFMQSKFRTVAATAKRGVLALQAVMTHLQANAPQVLPGLYSSLGATDASDGLERKNRPKPWLDLFNTRESVGLHCASVPRPLRIVTYNLWNTQGDWTARKDAIVREIKASQFDVVGLQEVRMYQAHNQLEDLMKDLSPLGYVHAYVPVTPASDNDSEEGLGLIARHPIVGSVRSMIISSPNSPPRRVMAVSLSIRDKPSSTPRTLEVFVTHWSYVDTEQCFQSVRTVQFMNEIRADAAAASSSSSSTSSAEQILLGDFNQYLDWEWPVELLTRPLASAASFVGNPCLAVWQGMGLDLVQIQKILFPALGSNQGKGAAGSLQRTAGAAFRDVHLSVYPDEVRFPGVTFPISSFWEPQKVVDPCRPDRILVRQWITSTDGSVLPAPAAPPRNNLLECDVGIILPFALATEPKVSMASDHRGVLAVFSWAGDEEQSESSNSMENRLARAQAWKGTKQPPQPQAQQQPAAIPAPAALPPAKTPAAPAAAQWPPPLPPGLAPASANTPAPVAAPAPTPPVAAAPVSAAPSFLALAGTRLHSSLAFNANDVPEFMFDNDLSTFFWGNSSPQPGDWVSISFQPPLELSTLRSVVLRTGKPSAGGGPSAARLGDDLLPEYAVLEWGIAMSPHPQQDGEGAGEEALRALWHDTRSSSTPFFVEAPLPDLKPNVRGPLDDEDDDSLVVFLPSVLSPLPTAPSSLHSSAVAAQRALASIKQPVLLRALRVRIMRFMPTWLAIREVELERINGAESTPTSAGAAAAAESPAAAGASRTPRPAPAPAPVPNDGLPPPKPVPKSRFINI